MFQGCNCSEFKVKNHNINLHTLTTNLLSLASHLSHIYSGYLTPANFIYNIVSKYLEGVTSALWQLQFS